ncbi:phage portal protein family protein, partial [Vibrio sp. V39_P1S14PM300]|uniref:phage portal protein family protein n=1 Tax=Vibrio sp. V39_P1S14PM300 TaxID=1938690 RepID=UPI001372305F
ANIERLGEKYAIPTAIALAENANGDNDLQKIADSLAPVMNGDAVALSGVKEIVALDANGKVDELLRTIEYIDNKISKRITGQTLTGGNQKYGSRSLGEVHERAAMRVSKRDARMVHKTLNETLFKWIFLANGREGSIKIRVDEDAYKAMLESALANGSGMEPVQPLSPLTLSDAPGKHLCLL